MKDVKNILKDRIMHPKGQEWVNDLLDGDLDCKRLGICLAIELRKIGEEIVDFDHVNKIFDNCDYDRNKFITDKSYPRKWFSKRIDDLRSDLRNPTGCIIQTTQKIEPTSNVFVYVTFLSFYRLKKYYLDKIGFHLSVDSNNPDEVVDFITAYPDLLDKVNFFGNKNFPIWVTTFEEVERIKLLTSRYDEVTKIMNSLGLQPDTGGLSIFPNTGDLFFQILYPNNFPQVMFQPSSLNKDWANAQNDLYLSYIIKDYFGSTYATDASCLNAKEQIHEPFVCKNLGLRIYALGKHKALIIDKSKIIEEGKNRLKL